MNFSVRAILSCHHLTSVFTLSWKWERSCVAVVPELKGRCRKHTIGFRLKSNTNNNFTIVKRMSSPPINFVFDCPGCGAMNRSKKAIRRNCHQNWGPVWLNVYSKEQIFKKPTIYELLQYYKSPNKSCTNISPHYLWANRLSFLPAAAQGCLTLHLAVPSWFLWFSFGCY